MQDNTHLPTLTVNTNLEPVDLEAFPSTTPETPLSPSESEKLQNKPKRSLSIKKALSSVNPFKSQSISAPSTPTASHAEVTSPLKSAFASSDAQNKLDKHVNIVESSGEQQPTAEVSQSAGQEPDADAAPKSPAPDQQAPIVPKETLRSAFDYTFSTSANIETAQQMFRDACADHVYPVNSYSRQEFISLLKEKLWYRRRFASKEFFQVFINIAAFVHQYVDPGLDYEIAAAFAQAQMGPKWIFASRLEPRMHLNFNNGMHTHYLCHLDRRPSVTDDYPEPGSHVEMKCMLKSGSFNAELIKAAGDRVDPRKKTLDKQTRFLWKNIMLKRRLAWDF